MEEIEEIKQQLDIIARVLPIIDIYNKEEIISENTKVISNVIPTIHANLNKIESRLEEINNRVEYINRVMNLLEKPTNLNQLKYLLKVIQIELDQL